ncbi:MAG TPA: hypothetical protein VE396_16665, partial [Xanthobacteraceae bacterium]|nr:hypothetical protein [Xanthobacteraceae bacterium]
PWCLPMNVPKPIVKIYLVLRTILIFTAATAMLLGGLYLLGAEAFLVHHVFLRMVIVGLMLTLMGGYLFWANFVAPLFGVASGEQ